MAKRFVPINPLGGDRFSESTYYDVLANLLTDSTKLLEGTNLSDIENRPHSDLTGIDAADNADTDPDFNKHVSNALMKESKDHRDATNAHGATGDIIGNLDLATTLLTGVVFQATTQTDAVDSTVSVDATDAGATYTVAEQTLINELKADVNTLVTDLNNSIAVINALIDKLQTAGVMV